jgi:hypothetical protein
MKRKLKQLLIFWIILNAFLLILSFCKVRNSGEEVTFIPWAYPLGAFVWEDLLIFSLYNVIASVVILLIKDFRFIIVFSLIFWLVRSLGETFYWFLQQFNQPALYPHSEYDWNKGGWVKAIFGDLSDQKYFILYQVGWQVISVLCITGLIYLFKNWERIGQRVNC